MSSYTIGQLASAVGVPTSTLRYYERSGLLKPDFRTEGNYRAYSPEALERLRFIRAAQATGFSLQDVQEMLQLTYSTEPPCREIVTLLQNRLADIRARVKELRRMENALSKALTTCCRGGRDWCQEIERLKRKPHSTKPAKKIAVSP
ncbi:MAG TPA: heavy metal-responsive transcriptional regulator [Tepidisphaeraceae bacterium]|jgi:MerR family mercuric resistance operon transcriptional regulator|nr:heavy metal-responsive transcriptional regulator [Tepidisphaeraceae bacterium]